MFQFGEILCNDANKKNILTENILVENNIDLNQYLDKNLTSAVSELKFLLKDTTYKINDCTDTKPNFWIPNTINLYSIDNMVAKIEHVYGRWTKIESICSNKYILFYEIASKYGIYGPTYTKMMKLITIEHVRNCLVIKEDITLKDIINTNVLKEDEYLTLFNYMLKIINEYDLKQNINRVKISKIDLTKYIGQNYDDVLLDLTENLVEKYKIIDCRGAITCVAYAYAVYIYPNKNKVEKIKYVDGFKNEGEVTEEGYIKRKIPSFESLKDYFDKPIDDVLLNIRKYIKELYGGYDCRRISSSFGFDTFGLMAYCDSKNIVKLFKYTEEKMHIVRPTDHPCKNKKLSDISLNKYIGTHIDDTFLELTKLLDEKYVIVNYKHKNFSKSNYTVKLYCNDDNIIKVITYSDGNDDTNLIYNSLSTDDITTIDLKNYISKPYTQVFIELVEKFGNKYKINPTDKNTKKSIFIEQTEIYVELRGGFVGIVLSIKYVDEEGIIQIVS